MAPVVLRVFSLLLGGALAFLLPSSVVVPPRGRSRLSALPDLEEGAMVIAQDREEVWYRAEILRVEDDKALVHYLGWEDYWDEWLPADRIAAAPPSEPSYVSEDDLTDEAFAARRVAAAKMNDLWQFSQFADAFCGLTDLTGITRRYVLEQQKLSLARTTLSSLSCVRVDDVTEPPTSRAQVDEFHRSLEAQFSYDGGLKTHVVRPETFGTATTAANANAFTTASRDDDDDDDDPATAKKKRLTCEVWMKRDTRVVGLTVAYAYAENESWLFDYADLRKLNFDDQEFAEDAPYDQARRPIYDPHPYLSREDPVLQLTLPGAITFAFPRTLADDACKGIVSLDWTHGDQRSQVDRVFDTPDASLASFEVTDTLAEPPNNAKP